MSEKVLGFKEKDVCFGNMWMYHIQKDKLVPVVSVEKFEKEVECIDDNFWGTNHAEVVNAVKMVIILKLKKAVRLRAKKKGE